MSPNSGLNSIETMLSKLISVAASMALLLSSLPHATPFATKPLLSVPSTTAKYVHHNNDAILSTQFTSTSSTSLSMSKEDEPYDTGYVDGSTTGAFLMAFVLLINIWIFSIPTEFRRARICKEEDVVLYPNKNCITADEWFRGVGDYYKNGGGVQFDFSIEGR